MMSILWNLNIRKIFFALDDSFKNVYQLSRLGEITSLSFSFCMGKEEYNLKPHWIE